MAHRPAHPQWLRELGARLADARNRAGLTQADVAKKLGMPRDQTIGDYESGSGNPSAFDLFQLAKLYSNTSLDFLVGLSDRPNFKGCGGIINLAVERAILSANTWQEAETAARRLEVWSEGGILPGYEVPSEFEVLSDAEWESRRKNLLLKLKRLAHERGKPTRRPPRNG